MPREAAFHDGVDVVLVDLVVTDQVLQAEMRFPAGEVRGQEGQEGRDALVDAVVRLLGLEVAQGALTFLAEQSVL